MKDRNGTILNLGDMVVYTPAGVSGTAKELRGMYVSITSTIIVDDGTRETDYQSSIPVYGILFSSDKPNDFDISNFKFQALTDAYTPFVCKQSIYDDCSC